MTFGTELKLLLVWLLLAEIAAVILTAILVVRKPPESDGFWRAAGRYFLLSSAIATCLPVLLLILRTVKAIAGVFVQLTPVLADWWWTVPVALALGGTAFVLWRFWLRRESEAKQADRYMTTLGYNRPVTERLADARALADSGLVPVQPPPSMWSLPDEHRGGGL